jgi:hypothetical protein
MSGPSVGKGSVMQPMQRWPSFGGRCGRLRSACRLNADPTASKRALFLERLPGLLEMDDFLPRQQGAAIDLRAHQQDALDWLALIRAEGKTLSMRH